MLLMDFPYTEDQLVPNFAQNVLSQPTFQPQESLPDFDSLMSDLSATFNLQDTCSAELATPTTLLGGLNVNTSCADSITVHNSPVHSMEISQHVTPVNEDVTFYDESVFIKQEPEDCSFNQKLNMTEPLVTIKQEMSPLGYEQEYPTLQSTQQDPMLAETSHQAQLADVKKEMDHVCNSLSIPGNPYKWNAIETRRWAEWVLSQYKFQPYFANAFCMDGTQLCLLTVEAFKQKCPEAGPYLFEELQIWRDTYSFATASPVIETHTYTDLEPVRQRQNYPSAPAYPQASSIEVQIPRPVLNTSPSVSPAPSLESLESSSSSSHSFKMSPSNSVENLSKPLSHHQPLKSVTPGKHNIQLWQFLRELLMTPVHYGQCIRWLDRSKGIFKIEDSQRVARLWGQRKNRPAMNYDKLSRSVRQYYKKGIIKKTDNSKRLVYQFCPQYRI